MGGQFSMVKISDFTFPSSDGVHSIHCRQWLPEGDVRMAVQLVHGVAEHIRRYDAFAAYLAGQGIAVTGDDHLGHVRASTTARSLAGSPKRTVGSFW